MKQLFPIILLLAFFLVGFTGCETTEDGYGYMATGLDNQSVLDLFAVSDRSVNNRDYATYSSLFGPRFTMRDKSPAFGMSDVIQDKGEYLDEARNILNRAKEVSVATSIREIDFDASAQVAHVQVQEEQYLDYQGKKRKSVSIVDYEIGYEDGWMYFTEMTVSARRYF